MDVFNARLPGAFWFMKPFPSCALLTTPWRLCAPPSSSSNLQLCRSAGHIKY